MCRIPTEPDNNRPTISYLNTNNTMNYSYVYRIRYKKKYYSVIVVDSRVINLEDNTLLCELKDWTPSNLSDIKVEKQPSVWSLIGTILLTPIVLPVYGIVKIFNRDIVPLKQVLYNYPPISLEHYKRVGDIGRQLETMNPDDIKKELDKITVYINDAMKSKH